MKTRSSALRVVKIVLSRDQALQVGLHRLDVERGQGSSAGLSSTVASNPPRSRGPASATRRAHPRLRGQRGDRYEEIERQRQHDRDLGHEM